LETVQLLITITIVLGERGIGDSIIRYGFDRPEKRFARLGWFPFIHLQWKAENKPTLYPNGELYLS
jgi:hypothetical protein